MNHSHGNDTSKIVRCNFKTKIKQINFDGKLIKVWENVEDASSQLGVKKYYISRVLTKKRNSFMNCLWEYEGE